METKKRNPLLFVLLHFLQVCAFASSECPSLPQQNLTCYNDYNQNITCLWNSTNMSDDTNSVCTINAKNNNLYNPFSASCILEPVDVSRPALKKCSLIFKHSYTFTSTNVLSMNLSCNPVKQSVNISYRPSCHVKLSPPTKPDINNTTVTWLNQLRKHYRIKYFNTQLQWKQQDQPWKDPPLQPKRCELACDEELDEDQLIQGERYEARVRVQPSVSGILGPWSDWSPTTSWVSPVGKIKPPAPSDVPVDFLHIYIIAGVVAFALMLAFVISRTDRTAWVYAVKKIPNPANSFLRDTDFQSWLSPHFTNESLHSFLKPLDIVSVEITSTVDVIAPYRPDEKTRMRNESSHQSNSSSFSNPIYANLFAPPHVSAGNLEPCDADTPYGPVGCQGEGNSTEQGNDDMREREMAILKLLSEGSSDSESVQVISDYEKVDKLQTERLRLQSLDSGMCSCEEVIQESKEADSMNVADSHDEGLEEDEEKDGGRGIKVNILKLFGSSGAIQVCSDYERVQTVHSPEADSPELPSVDSGVSSGGEEQVSQEESMEEVDKATESTRFLFPPHPSSALPCSLLSSQQLPLSFSGAGFGPVLQPQHDYGLEKMSSSRSVEPCTDGYMPVRQVEGREETETLPVGQ